MTSAALGLVCAALFAREIAVEIAVGHTSGLARRKGETDAEVASLAPAASSPASPPTPPDGAIGPPAPLLATLVQTHTDERVPLDVSGPTTSRFDALLADRVTGSTTALDSRLLGLLRTMAIDLSTRGAAVRIELVSGFRSPKLNEMLRKKGHHVASRSQHSLGHAVDFRVVVPCEGVAAIGAACDGGVDPVALDPRVVARAIRDSGWTGGVGIYTSKDDWFVHADVGPNRSWYEGPGAAEPP